MKPFSRSRIAVLLALLSTAVVVNLFPQQTVSHIIARLMPTATGESQRYELATDSVIDGTTLAVSKEQQTIEIDLCGIKVPDQTEDTVSGSKDALRRLVAQGHGGRVTLVLTKAKPQNQLIAEAFLPTGNPDEEIHLNSQMLLEGMAIVDPQSIDTCPNGSRLRVAKAEAKQRAAGVWSSSPVEKG